ETFTAVRGGRAYLNDRPIRVRKAAAITAGTVAVGSSRRSPPDRVALLLRSLVEAGGVFQRMGSGALGLAYVAAGRYLGYVESYMNAWDCLAGQLLIEEAGGRVEDQNAETMIAQGGRVVAAAPGVFAYLQTLTDDTFGTDVALPTKGALEEANKS
ncbi:MAG: inositol monophosphatase family protein, partial [Pseudomonadota bacterium]